MSIYNITESQLYKNELSDGIFLLYVDKEINPFDESIFLNEISRWRANRKCWGMVSSNNE